MEKEYYVYAYIDPRNYEEFYYGKGKGSRKDVHLFDDSSHERTKRIKSIRNDGLEPIIRVLASSLTEDEALLVESTLIWKFENCITNEASGCYSEHFRPHNSYHKKLEGFDFENGLYYYNVGECDHRNWDDYVKYGFISAGGSTLWRDAIQGFITGDVFIAYLKEHGYIGIGKIAEKAQPIKDILINNQPLMDLDLKAPKMGDRSNSHIKSEYVCLVKWVKTVSRENAIWQPRSGLYTTTHVRASLSNQEKTIKFIEKEFAVNLYELIL